MKKHKFSVIYDVNRNYSPRDCMIRYAKANDLKFGYTAYFNIYVVINGRYYIYDYWKIENQNNGYEEVTIVLKEITISELKGGKF